MKTTLTILLSAVLAATNVQAASFSAMFSPTAPESAKAAAKAAHAAGKIVPRQDEIDGSVTVRLPELSSDGGFEEGSKARIGLSIVKLKGEKPALFLHFECYSYGWLFIRSADFKLGTNHVELTCKDPRHDTIWGSLVEESASWCANDNAKIQGVIRAVAYGTCNLCALRGSEGRCLARVSKENFEPILSAWFALGGGPLTLKEP